MYNEQEINFEWSFAYAMGVGGYDQEETFNEQEAEDYYRGFWAGLETENPLSD